MPEVTDVRHRLEQSLEELKQRGERSSELQRSMEKVIQEGRDSIQETRRNNRVMMNAFWIEVGVFGVIIILTCIRLWS